MPPSSSPSEPGDPVLLVVEDDADTVALIEHALADPPVPLDLEAVPSTVEAIQRVREGEAGSRALPALVLLDLNLGEGSGFDVLAAIRASPQAHLLPVVVFSSSAEDSDVQRALELGANSYVRKPVRFEDLQEALLEIASYWLSLNRVPGDLRKRPSSQRARDRGASRDLRT